MSSFFPTENHLVICSAHERKAPGHLKVGHIPALHMHFPFSNTGVKSLIFCPPPSPVSPPADLFLCSLFRSPLLCLSVLFSWICRRQCLWLPIKLKKAADKLGILMVSGFVWMSLECVCNICTHITHAYTRLAAWCLSCAHFFTHYAFVNSFLHLSHSPYWLARSFSSYMRMSQSPCQSVCIPLEKEQTFNVLLAFTMLTALCCFSLYRQTLLRKW